MSRVIVFHARYGCETGCCGHVVQVGDGDWTEDNFQFTHPYVARTSEEIRNWIQELVTEQAGAEHVADIDWENCLVTNSC